MQHGGSCNDRFTIDNVLDRYFWRGCRLVLNFLDCGVDDLGTSLWP